jgi:hypothetical protein
LVFGLPALGLSFKDKSPSTKSAIYSNYNDQHLDVTLNGWHHRGQSDTGRLKTWLTSLASFDPQIGNPRLSFNRFSISRDAARGNGESCMTRQVFRERECVHRDDGANGEFYNGVFYLQALQRLRVDEAVQLASKVSSFFWADAPHILVWLCNDCAVELRLTDTPRALTHASRRQA